MGTTRSSVWCRASVVQGECGAGKCGAVWCRANVVQGECGAGHGANKVQGVVCMASVVQGGVQADGVQWVWCRKCGAASPCWRVVHAMWFVVSGRCGAGGRHISE